MNNKPTMREILSKKEKKAGKEDVLEKNDFKALLIAAFSVMGPILIAGIVILGIAIFVFTKVFH